MGIGGPNPDNMALPGDFIPFVKGFGMWACNRFFRKEVVVHKSQYIDAINPIDHVRPDLDSCVARDAPIRPSMPFGPKQRWLFSTVGMGNKTESTCGYNFIDNVLVVASVFALNLLVKI